MANPTVVAVNDSFRPQFDFGTGGYHPQAL